MFNKIYQVFEYVRAKDGVSHVICDMAKTFNEYGIYNRLYGVLLEEDCDYIKSDWREISSLDNDIASDVLLIYHYAGPTKLISHIAGMKCHKVLYYHNITPPVFFNGYSNVIRDFCETGLKEICTMSSKFPRVWGASGYNCEQLKKVGFKSTYIANFPYDFNRLRGNDADIGENNMLHTNILFVGRIAPNKRIEDIIKAFYYYHKINNKSKLYFVGGYEFYEGYMEELKQIVYELGVPVEFTGSVSQSQLVYYYKIADLFLCMSEHEGFCIPIIEAMYLEIPVLAFASSAVIETVGNAGILFHQKHFPAVAQLMNVVLNNTEIIERMKQAGKERAKYFSKAMASKRLIDLVKMHSDELSV